MAEMPIIPMIVPTHIFDTAAPIAHRSFVPDPTAPPPRRGVSLYEFMLWRVANKLSGACELFALSLSHSDELLPQACVDMDARMAALVGRHCSGHADFSHGGECSGGGGSC